MTKIETPCLSVDAINVLATQKGITLLSAAHLAGVNCALACMDEDTAEAEYDSIRDAQGQPHHSTKVRRDVAMAFFKGWEAIERT